MFALYRPSRKTGAQTFYIDEQEKENEQVMMGAAVQSVFDIAASIIGPGDGLLVTVLKGVKNFGQKAINVALRTGDPAELARLDPYIKAATEGVSQLPSYTGTVWRGAALTDSIVANYATEQILTERAFLSTSADIKGYFSRHNTEFVIQSNGGGKDVSAVSFLPEQKEVLFPPGTQFKVLGVELKSIPMGKNIIYLNELK